MHACSIKRSVGGFSGETHGVRPPHRGAMDLTVHDTHVRRLDDGWSAHRPADETHLAAARVCGISPMENEPPTPTPDI